MEVTGLIFWIGNFWNTIAVWQLFQVRFFLRNIPAAVETKLTFPANPNWLMAATLSPPPTREKAPFFVACAIALAITRVPC